MKFGPKEIKALVEAHIEVARNRVPKWEKYRRMYRCQRNTGEQTHRNQSQQDEGHADNGDLFGFVETMVAAISPRNPLAQVLPRSGSEALVGPAKYREALLGYSFKLSGLEWAIRRAATYAALSPEGYGMIKGTWRMDRRIVDYIPLDSQNCWFDWGVKKWDDIQYVIEVQPLPRREFESRILTWDDIQKLNQWKAEGEDPNTRPDTGGRWYDPAAAQGAIPSTYPDWLTNGEGGRYVMDRIRKAFEWVLVYEVHDYTNDLFWVMMEGREQPLYVGPLPYLFVQKNFAPIIFTDDLDSLRGIPDAQIIERPLDNMDELDSLELRFVRTSIPTTYIDKAAFSDPEKAVDNIISNTQPGDVSAFTLKDNKSFDAAITYSQTPTLSPTFSDIREKQKENITFRQGLPEYARGVATGSELATELSLINQALQTRQGWRIAAIMGCIQRMATVTIGLYEEFLDPESTLSVRLGPQEFLAFQRAHLSMRDPALVEWQIQNGMEPEPPLEVDYEVVPYQPASNTKPAQLARLVQAYPMVKDNPDFDQRKVSEKLAGLLEIEDCLVPKAQAAQTRAQMAAQGAGGQGSPPKIEVSQDSPLNGGGIPYDVGAGEVSTAASGDMMGGAGFPMPASAAGGA